MVKLVANVSKPAIKPIIIACFLGDTLIIFKKFGLK
jgi:hypothetical protein